MWETKQRRNQWLLPLYDSNDADIETGVLAVITINPTKRGKWGVGIYVKLDATRGWRTNDLIFVSNTPEEAKRKVDKLLRSNSPEFPPREDENPDGLGAALKDANFPQIIEGYCDIYRQIEHELASGLEVSSGDRAEYERIKAKIQSGYSLRDTMVLCHVDMYLTLWDQDHPGMLDKIDPEEFKEFRERLFRVFAAHAVCDPQGRVTRRPDSASKTPPP